MYSKKFRASSGVENGNKIIDQRRIDVSTASSNVPCKEMCLIVSRSVGRSVGVFTIWVCRCSVLRR